MYLKHEGKQYKYESGKLFIIENSWLNTLGSIVLVIVVLLFIYDFGKDMGRVFSGYRDLFRGEGSQGLLKITGFTRGNVIRQMIKISLFIVSILLLSHEKKKEITPIPDEIKGKLNYIEAMQFK